MSASYAASQRIARVLDFLRPASFQWRGRAKQNGLKWTAGGLAR